MPRPSFKGLSKSKDVTWKVHYQHHPTLHIVIKSKPRKYFSIKKEDDGELFIKYYDKILTIRFETYDYVSALQKFLPELKGTYFEANDFYSFFIF